VKSSDDPLRERSGTLLLLADIGISGNQVADALGREVGDATFVGYYEKTSRSSAENRNYPPFGQ
jgi:hypothetical protein